MTTTSVQLPVPHLTSARRSGRDQITSLLTMIRRGLVHLGRHRTGTATPSDQALSTIDHIRDLHR